MFELPSSLAVPWSRRYGSIMKSRLAISLFCLSFLQVFCPWRCDAILESTKVYVLPIRDDIAPPLVYVVRRGVKAVTGLDMPVFEKRRFQHGAVAVDQLRRQLPSREADYRRQFLALYQ